MSAKLAPMRASGRREISATPGFLVAGWARLPAAVLPTQEDRSTHVPTSMPLTRLGAPLGRVAGLALAAMGGWVALTARG